MYARRADEESFSSSWVSKGSSYETLHGYHAHGVLRVPSIATNVIVRMLHVTDLFWQFGGMTRETR